MPQCKKCNAAFPNRLLVEGKYRSISNRSYCLECKPFGKKGRFPVAIEALAEGVKFSCQNCLRPYVYKKRAGHTKSLCNSCMANRYRRERKRVALDYLGGVCVVCGYSRCPRALHFHHKDPSLKLFTISGTHCYRWEIVKKELDKCVILCSICHAEFEDGLLDVVPWIQ